MNLGHEAWQPLSIAETVRIFGAAPFRWWVSGGCALELHMGVSWRSHGDLDVGICRPQAAEVRSWLRDWDLLVAVAGELSPWDGRPLSLDDHENNIWARRDALGLWEIDLTLSQCTDEDWVYRRDPTVTRPWDLAVLRTPGGIPYLAPELQLLFKSKDPRPEDNVDALRVIPAMGEERRGWLAEHLDSDHPWRSNLGATPWFLS